MLCSVYYRTLGICLECLAISCLLCSCSWYSACLEFLLPSLPVNRWTFVFELCLAFSFSIKILYLWCSLWFIHYTNHKCSLGTRQWMWSQLIVRWEDRSFKTNFKKCPFSHLFFTLLSLYQSVSSWQWKPHVVCLCCLRSKHNSKCKARVGT